ncbi:MAG: hypothetical protein M3Q14_03670 [bacterium]|nr:hypothetical protein [bacterium]
MIMGLVGVALMYVGVAGIVSTTTPWWLGRGDAPRHIDYAYSLYKKDIPQFSDPLRYPVFNSLADGNYRDQPAAVNPPLFYLLHAPLIGPFLESGNWKDAIAIGRAFNIFIGVICIIALAWGGWLFGGKRKPLIAIAVPAFGVMTHNFTSLNQNYAVDVLLILLTTLSFILAYKIILHGPTKKYILYLALLSFLGMSTKATYVVFLLISFIAVVIATMTHGRESKKKNLFRGIIISGLIGALVLFTVGWYYFFQNFVESGNWVSAAPDNYGSTGRPYKSLNDVLTSSGLWGMLYERIAATKMVSILITAVATMGVATIYDKYRLRKFRYNKSITITALLMFIATLGILFTQIFHSVGYGGFYFRYFLPVLLPIALFFSYGLLELRWLRGQLVTITAILMAATTIDITVKGSAFKQLIPGISSVGSTEGMVKIAALNNGFNIYLVILLYAIILLGIFILGLSLFLLSSATLNPQSDNFVVSVKHFLKQLRA